MLARSGRPSRSVSEDQHAWAAKESGEPHARISLRAHMSMSACCSLA